MHSTKLALLSAVAIIAGFAMTTAPTASAATYVQVTVARPPPPLRVEPVPAARPGYVWAPGYWHWSGKDYVWAAGTWKHERTGYVYHSPEWTNVNGHWVYHDSYWGHGPHH